LVDDARGTAALEAYYSCHADIAVRHGCGVILETPTFRASRDWGSRIGYPPAELRRVNRSAVDLLSRVRSSYPDAARSPVVISGSIGPRADAYRPAARMSEDEAQDYHAEQIGVLAATEADLVHATTISYAAEAIGIARAAARARVPAVISFTTETDGRLPDGTSVADAHPSHFEPTLPGGAAGARVRSVRANASTKSHAELNGTQTLDDGDPNELAGDYLPCAPGTPGSPSSAAAAAPTRGTYRPSRTRSLGHGRHRSDPDTREPSRGGVARKS
jgi:homocysteine S-methyltransferase